jgi:hypothetical protein
MSDNLPAVIVQPKPWYTSKVVIVNGLTIAGALLIWLIDSQTAGALPFEMDAKWVAFILAGVNFILRFVTTAPVTASKDGT